ncbi:MAG: DNA-binding protein [Clostridiales bacterium]|nr:DNA-binding protein [Clostridiales bacterium]
MEYIKSERSYIIRLDRGEEVLEAVSALCERESIKAGFVTGLGAANDIEIGIFDTQKKEYYKQSYRGDFEISALVGNISRQEGKPYLHFHITIGNPKEGKFAAGHLSRCVISATAEIYLTEVDADVDREFSEEIGLNLIKF